MMSQNQIISPSPSFVAIEAPAEALLFFTSTTLSLHPPSLRGQKVGEGTATHIREPPPGDVLRLEPSALATPHLLGTMRSMKATAPGPDTWYLANGQ